MKGKIRADSGFNSSFCKRLFCRNNEQSLPNFLGNIRSESVADASKMFHMEQLILKLSPHCDFMIKIIQYTDTKYIV